MGLDAYVYRSRNHLDFIPEEVGAELDSTTGGYFFSDPKAGTSSLRENCIAVHRRIGNISMVALLRRDVRQLLDQESIVLSKILYSGSHCGDTLPIELMPPLQREIEILKQAAEASLAVEDKYILEFVESMELLIAAALYEDNPIVF